MTNAHTNRRRLFAASIVAICCTLALAAGAVVVAEGDAQSDVEFDVSAPGETVIPDETTLQVESDLEDGYHVHVSSEELSQSALLEVFDGAEPAGGGAVNLTDLNASEEVTADLTGVEPGTYTLAFDVVDHDASDDVTFEVVEPVVVDQFEGPDELTLTLNEALEVADEDARIEVPARTFTETVVVDTPGVQIRGDGDGPEGTVVTHLESDASEESAVIDVRVPGVGVEDLRVELRPDADRAEDDAYAYGIVVRDVDVEVADVSVRAVEEVRAPKTVGLGVVDGDDETSNVDINGVETVGFHSGVLVAEFDENDVASVTVSTARLVGNVDGVSVVSYNGDGASLDMFTDEYVTDVTVEGTIFHDNDRGIHVPAEEFQGDAIGEIPDGGEVVVTNSEFDGNAAWGVLSEADDGDVDATENYWSAEDGPAGEADGGGDAVSTSVSYEPWLESPIFTGEVDASVDPGNYYTRSSSTHTYAIDVGADAGVAGEWLETVRLGFPDAYEDADLAGAEDTTATVTVEGTSVEAPVRYDEATGAVVVDIGGDLRIEGGDAVSVAVDGIASPPAGTYQLETGLRGDDGGVDRGFDDVTLFEPFVAVADQETDGTTVEVDSVVLPDGGFVVVYAEGEVSPDAVRGNSSYLEAGIHDNVSVELDDPFYENATAVVRPHADTDGNGQFDYATTDGDVDDPYLVDGEPVEDGTTLEVNWTGPIPTPTPPEDGEDGADDEDDADDTQPVLPGGGGAPAPAPAPAPSEPTEAVPEGAIDIVDATPDVAGTTVQIPDRPVTEITFAADDLEGYVTVESVAVLPAGISQPPDRAVEFVEITVPEDQRNAAATLTFVVEADSAAGLEVVRFDEDAGAWQSLETAADARDDGTVVLTAETPGFSYFAVTDTGEAASTPTPTPTETETPTPTEWSTPTETDETSEEAGFQFGGWMVALLLLVLSFAAGGFVVSKGLAILENSKRHPGP